MATTDSFRKSISELDLLEQLACVLGLRAERRMIPERKIKTKKSAARAKKPKKQTVAVYLDNLGESEKQLMLDNLLKLKKKRQR